MNRIIFTKNPQLRLFLLGTNLNNILFNPNGGDNHILSNYECGEEIATITSRTLVDKFHETLMQIWSGKELFRVMITLAYWNEAELQDLENDTRLHVEYQNSTDMIQICLAIAHWFTIIGNREVATAALEEASLRLNTYREIIPPSEIQEIQEQIATIEGMLPSSEIKVAS